MLFVAGSSIRQQVLGELKKKFATVTEAEDAMGITVESYIDGTPGGPANLPDELQQLHVSPALLGKMKSLSPNQIGDLVIEGLASLGGGRTVELPLLLELVMCWWCSLRNRSTQM